jgi:CheY-like chemotaxis protein
VDDEPDALDLIRVILRQSGASVTTAGTASAALEAFEAEGADVIVCDIGMPGEDGYAFIRRVRARGRRGGGATPAIALTAYAAESDRVRALDAGFQLHVPKPIDPASLVRVVAGVVGKGEEVRREG